MTTLRKPIKVPANRDVCEVCAITKIENSIPKELSQWKKTKLALIEFDIAGLLPTLLRGNRHFCLIIDSFSRKNWVLPLALKGDVQKALEEWRKEVEH